MYLWEDAGDVRGLLAGEVVRVDSAFDWYHVNNIALRVRVRNTCKALNSSLSCCKSFPIIASNKQTDFYPFLLR